MLGCVAMGWLSVREARMEKFQSNIPVGSRPTAIAVNPQTNKIYVANCGTSCSGVGEGDVTVINGANHTTYTVYVQGPGRSRTTPVAIAVNQLTDKIYIANNNSGDVTVINGADNTTATVVAGGAPNDIAVNPATNKIYVANSASNTVTVINGANNTRVPVPTGTNPYAIAVNPVTNKIYVANRISQNVTVIDGANNTTATVPAGSSPLAVAVNSVTNKIYVANQYGDNVTVINGADNTTSTVTAGTSPVAIAINPVTDKIYVANQNSSNVTVINGANNTTETVGAGLGPRGLAINQLTNKIYVANQFGSNVTVINGADNTTATIPVSNGPVAIAVNPVTNKTYVANQDSDEVSVINSADSASTNTWHVSPAPMGDGIACTQVAPCASITQAISNAAPSGDTIEVAAGTYLEHNINVNKSLTIHGASASTTTVDAQQLGRAFIVNAGATVDLSNLQITGGKSADGLEGALPGPSAGGDGENGGGISNQGRLSLSNCIVTNNHAGDGGISHSIGSVINHGAGGSGGGIFNSGTLNIIDSTVKNNFGGNGLPFVSNEVRPSRGGSGGGIFNTGTLNIFSSTIHNNLSGFGGGGFRTAKNGGDGGGINNNGTLRIINSTISDNQAGDGGNGATNGDAGAGGNGGGISNTGSMLTIINSTISNNRAGVGGNSPLALKGGNGGGIKGDVTNIRNSIVTDNSLAPGGTGPDVNGTVNSRGHNLIGKSNGSTGFDSTCQSDQDKCDQLGTIASPLNALLGPLQNNGGPTFTRALFNGSPAIDYGDGCVTLINHCDDPEATQLTTDQRGAGFPRTQDDPFVDNLIYTDGTDIGAFEGRLRDQITWRVSNGSTGACTEADSNCASIQTAVTRAAAGDTIEVAAATYNEHDIRIDGPLTIVGAGAGNTIIDAQQQGRGFILSYRAVVDISNLKITGGRSANGAEGALPGPSAGGDGENGGGISNQGTLSLNNCIVTNNHAGDGGLGHNNSSSNLVLHGAGGSGGGISNTGTLTIINSTIDTNFSGNGRQTDNLLVRSSPGGSGGGIFNTGTLNIFFSTIHNNVSGSGGGLGGLRDGKNGGDGGGINSSGTLRIINSTISDNLTGIGGSTGSNSAAGTGGNGGGINHTGSMLTIINSTISNNRTGVGGNSPNASKGGSGGGIKGDVTNIRNSIVADNGVAPGGTGPDVNGTVNSRGHNLIGKSDGSTGFDATCQTAQDKCDKAGTIASPLNALLGPLQDNGGPTFTRALLKGSPAVDSGDDCVTDINHCADPGTIQLITDQRRAGFPRNFGNHVDIGAYELSVATPATTPPAISCPSNIAVNNDAGQFSASVPFNVTATGMPSPTIECKVGSSVITSPHTFAVGTTMVQCTATNGVSPNASCSFTVTVTDTQTPVISCPANKVVNTDAGSCTASAATVSAGTATATDNDPAVSVTGVRSDGQPLSAAYPKGVTTITWTATDTAHNSASCQQNVTVTDNTPPSITAPANVNAWTGANATSCGVSISDSTLGTATASDLCYGTVNVVRSGVPTGNIFPVGQTTITYTATDAAGNTRTATQTVTVTDNTLPTITAPAAASYQCLSGVPAANPAQATAADNCGTPSVTVSESNNGGVGSTASPLIITRTFTAKDSANNTKTATQTITVIDNTKPTVSAPAPTSASANSSCRAAIPNVVSGSTAADNCGGMVTLSQNPVAGTLVGLGTQTITVTATDVAGNTNTATTTFTVNDTTAPTFTLNGLAIMTVERKTAFVDPGATATDGCAGNLSSAIVKTGSVNTNTVGTYTLTYSVNDGRGNSSSFTRTVKVVDTTPPTMTCPSPITVDAVSELGSAVTYPLPAAIDAGAAVPVSCLPATGSVFAMGSTAVQCKATDASQNTTSCTFTVTIRGVRDTKLDVLNQLIGLRAGVTDSRDRKKLDDAIRDLTRAVEVSQWIDTSHPKPLAGEKIFEQEAQVVETLGQLLKDKHSPIADVVLQTLITRLVGADRVLALLAIKEAKDARGNARRIAQATEELNQGDEQARKKGYSEAIDHYSEAWKLALMATGKLRDDNNNNQTG
jgi:YVTN family beta-propeller protein